MSTKAAPSSASARTTAGSNAPRRGEPFESHASIRIRGALLDELGVSESRVSQLRSEPLALLKDGINSQLEPAALEPEPRPDGRVARRKAAYYAAIAASSDLRGRLDSFIDTVAPTVAPDELQAPPRVAPAAG